MTAEEEGDPAVAEAARELSRLLSTRGLTLACAESCTGGLVSAALTEIPGASRFFWGAVVSYANGCKERLLGVDPATLESRGAVSRECAEQMAAGALRISGADLAIAVTGIAGPEGGSPGKPVGTVWLAWASAAGAARQESRAFVGGRAAIRAGAAARALRGAAEFAEDGSSGLGGARAGEERAIDKRR